MISLRMQDPRFVYLSTYKISYTSDYFSPQRCYPASKVLAKHLSMCHTAYHKFQTVCLGLYLRLRNMKPICLTA
jgi:hypothetical protein